MELLTPSLGLIVWTLLAFLIVYFLLRKFAWGPILNSLNQREKTIADSLESAQRVKAEMAQLKNENEELMARAREERSLMLKEARETKFFLRMVATAEPRLKQGAKDLWLEGDSLHRIFSRPRPSLQVPPIHSR